MKAWGFECEYNECVKLWELLCHISFKVVIVIIVLLILWFCRKHVTMCWRQFFAKPWHEKVRCQNCKKKRFQFEKNITKELYDDYAINISYNKYVGGFFRCHGCLEKCSVGIESCTLQQYNLFNESEWKKLVKTHNLVYIGCDAHIRWCSTYNDKQGIVMLCDQLSTNQLRFTTEEFGEIKHWCYTLLTKA